MWVFPYVSQSEARRLRCLSKAMLGGASASELMRAQELAWMWTDGCVSDGFMRDRLPFARQLIGHENGGSACVCGRDSYGNGRSIPLRDVRPAMVRRKASDRTLAV